jgi:hypothetical protein
VKSDHPLPQQQITEQRNSNLLRNPNFLFSEEKEKKHYQVKIFAPLKFTSLKPTADKKKKKERKNKSN